MRTLKSFALPATASALILVLTAAATDEQAVDPGPDQQPTVPPQVAAQMAAQAAQRGKKPELPELADIAEEYTKVISTADGAKSLWTIWIREKDGQMLAELPRNHEKQKLFIAYTVAGGTMTAGVQTGDMYAYWKRYDRQLALIEPNFAVRSSGDLESQKGRERVFTDRVILDIPIVAKGEQGGPVIDMDALLVNQAARFFGFAAAGLNPRLATIAKAKAFPNNVELAFELPMAGGRLGTLHYSISVLPEKTGYKSREADPRIGYFTTTYRDIGHPDRDTPWVRYVNRWMLEKADPNLKMSPPKEPIVFYLEHTIPVRYRRWVRDGVLEWNKAFEKVGIVNAVEVYQQDARTKAHMEKDPEDARYNFILWTNANMGFAIGPSRVDPRTGQILDADVVMDEGFITSWVDAWRKIIPETAMGNFGPETYAWLATRPQWDPRVRLAPPAQRKQVMETIQRDTWAGAGQPFAGHPAASADPTLLGDDAYDGLAHRVSQVSGRCDCAMRKSLDVALFRFAPDLLAELAMTGDDEGEGDKGEGDNGDEDENGDDEPKEDPGQMLDGIPEWFIGPLLKDVIMHEVGHTLGLRHNFKASSIYPLEQINSEDWKGKPITGSVMEYNPININFEDGDAQGEYGMVTLGPYDYWAIEYGYTMEKDLKPILARVAEPELAFATDEDSWGSDPLARTWDMGADPLEYAESQMRLVQHLRERLLERMVKPGESWAKARQGYELLLSRHIRAVAAASAWLGGAYVNRDHKGDPGERDPVTPASYDQQTRALQFIIDNVFDDDAFGLTPELLAKMTIDKWWDEGGMMSIFEDPAYPIHDRILGVQAMALTMLMNPTTLNRVYDNEFRIDADEDALTLPDIIWGVSDEVWSELDDSTTRKYTARKPMISSLRRNLQREHLSRLIDLSLPNAGFGPAAKPAANLSLYKLHKLSERIGELLEEKEAKLDPYTLSHLAEAQVRIDKALDAIYVYNINDMSAGGGLPFLLFQPTDR